MATNNFSSKSFSISANNTEIIRAKFNKTAMTIHGYLTEAHNDIPANQDYSANAVYTRIKAISLAFEADIRSLGQELDVPVSNPYDGGYSAISKPVKRITGASGFEKRTDEGRSGFSGTTKSDESSDANEIRNALNADAKFDHFGTDKWTMYNPVIDTIEATVVMQDGCMCVIKGGHPDEVLTFTEFIKKYTNGN